MKPSTSLYGVMSLVFVVALLNVVAPTESHAGEGQYLGTITVTDGGSVNNRSTAIPFTITTLGARISVQCPDAGAWTLAGAGRVSLRQGLFLPAGAAILTSVDVAATDAGTYSGGLFAIHPDVGATDTECIVLSSTGRAREPLFSR